MTIVKSYDVKCYELAECFLSDDPALNTEADRHAMALDIQQAIEDYFFSIRRGVTPEHARTAVDRERRAIEERVRYEAMSTDERCKMQGDGFINDYD